ncbi:hypothetical protein ACT2FY_38755 [Paraburkholderia fungorum]|uniref:hypothetical protein n=1 Tax=Paraburkholderia fungorum TaxID=134537 RepID=UPI00402B6095
MPFADWFSRFAGKRLTSEQPVSQVAIPTVKFDMSLVTDTVREMVREEIAQLSEIHGEYRDDITIAAIASISAGRDLAVLARALQATPGPSLSRARSAAIARHINNRATAMMSQQRSIGLGIHTAIWRYSVPCMDMNAPTDASCRTDRLHKNLNGKAFELNKGVLIEGRWVLPGQDGLCKCGWSPVIPGFED